MCVGMTGSGKTGLCLALIEEALIDGVPVLAVDPKGDLGNLMLTFPALAPADFAPWLDPAQAQRNDVSVDELAARTAARWREGLAASGQGPERIARLREAGEVAIYTPGAGKQRTAAERIAREKSQATASTADTAINVGASVFGALFGGRRGTASKVASAARSMSRAAQQRADVERASEAAAQLELQQAYLEEKLAQDCDSIRAAPEPPVEKLELTARKADTAVTRVALLWLPAE